MKRSILLGSLLGLIALVTACGGKSGLANLRCELLTDPTGIGVTAPRLSWEITSNEKDVRQTSYHILVASTPEKLKAGEGDLWDSGEVSSDNSIQVGYAGKPLPSRQTCYWKVKVTTNKGDSDWSKPASWTMALLNDSDWQAKWTGLDRYFEWDAPGAAHTRLSARYFRKEFESAKKVEKATVYLSGLGLYKLYVNGEVIGTQELAPTITDYAQSVKYNTLDVTKQIQEGNNALGVILGNGRFFSMRVREGMYGPNHHWLYHIKNFGYPKMLLQLEIEYTDGTRETVVSDDSWRVTPDGPIRANNEFDGEEYDATKEMPGWNKVGFDDSGWMTAELTTAPGGKLQAQLNPNIQVMETLKPVAIAEPKPGMHVLDMGQNMVGWLKIKVQGNAGDTVKMRFAELANPDGTLYMDNIREADVTDIYVLKGGGVETWEPMFVYHGFRFAEITGWPGKPTTADFEGKVLYDEMPVTGTFETSNETINQIYKNAYWGIRGNYRGMPTDCPQRDERMGWLGDRATGSQGESFVFGVDHLYAKWMDDIEQTQRENGQIPDIAPNYWEAYNDDMTWPAAYVIITNMLYNQYGDLEPVRTHYASMKKWLDYMKETHMVDYIMPRDTYGDWCMPPESPEMIHSQDPARRTDGVLLGTGFYYHLAKLMERFATLLDKSADAAYFADLSAKMKTAFNDRFLNKEDQYYSNNTVTANMMALWYGMVPEEYRQGVFDNVVKKTEGEFNSHVSTGLIGIQWLMRGLSEYGRPDLAFRIATNRDYPSWGYMIENGATTIWELWNGNTADPAMNSANHVMLLGDYVVWLYEYLAGIQNRPGSAGFKQIRMKPYPVDGLDHVTASFQSVHGMIKSAWKKADGKFKWDVTVPANTSAEVHVPVSGPQISDTDRQAIEKEGTTFVKMDGNYAVFAVPSGSYTFSTSL